MLNYRREPDYKRRLKDSLPSFQFPSFQSPYLWGKHVVKRVRFPTNGELTSLDKVFLSPKIMFLIFPLIPNPTFVLHTAWKAVVPSQWASAFATSLFYFHQEEFWSSFYFRNSSIILYFCTFKQASILESRPVELSWVEIKRNGLWIWPGDLFRYLEMPKQRIKRSSKGQCPQEP